MINTPDCPFCLKPNGVSAALMEDRSPAFACLACGAWFGENGDVAEWPKLKPGRAAAIRVKR